MSWEDHCGAKGMMEIHAGKADWEQTLEGIKASSTHLDFIL